MPSTLRYVEFTSQSSLTAAWSFVLMSNLRYILLVMPALSNPLIIGGISQIIIIGIIIGVVRAFPQTKFSQTVAYLIESMYGFFEEIT